MASRRGGRGTLQRMADGFTLPPSDRVLVGLLVGAPQSLAHATPVAIWANLASSVAPCNIGLGTGCRAIPRNGLFRSQKTRSRSARSEFRDSLGRGSIFLCSQTSLLCNQTSLLCNQTSLLCSQTSLPCSQTSLPCSQTSFNVRDGDDRPLVAPARRTCARGHRAQLQAAVSPSQGSCRQLLGRVSSSWVVSPFATTTRDLRPPSGLGLGPYRVPGRGLSPVLGMVPAPSSDPGPGPGPALHLECLSTCTSQSVVGGAAGVAGARSIACGSCSRRRPPLWRCQSCSARSTGGRSPTSSLVRLSATPSSTPVTAPIGMATLFLPHRCPSSRRTWVT